MKTMKTAKILELIEGYQHIQMTNRPDSVKWLGASSELHILFREMARRTSEVS